MSDPIPIWKFILVLGIGFGILTFGFGVITQIADGSIAEHRAMIELECNQQCKEIWNYDYIFHYDANEDGLNGHVCVCVDARVDRVLIE